MFRACSTFVSLKITENFYLRCLCAEVRGLLVICAARDLSVVLAQFIGDFYRVNQRKFSMNKHTQPNFMRDSCVYVVVGMCDHALRQQEFPGSLFTKRTDVLSQDFEAARFGFRLCQSCGFDTSRDLAIRRRTI